jgi:hypothetical protein
MKLYIPACGDRITLAAPWSFTLVLEHRNVEFAKTRKIIESAPRYGGVRDGGSGYRTVPVTLDVGTTLECDRIYIRTFNKSRVQVENDYDSITWKVINDKGKFVSKSRFWTKLPDTYGIEYDKVDMYRDRVKLAKLVMES